MKLRGKEKNKFINYILIIIFTFILFACFITLVMDIANNKGILPVIFFVLMIYSLLMFSYNFFNPTPKNSAEIKVSRVKFSYLLFFIVNSCLLVLSVIALWL
jgi:hypothetical protein